MPSGDSVHRVVDLDLKPGDLLVVPERASCWIDKFWAILTGPMALLVLQRRRSGGHPSVYVLTCDGSCLSLVVPGDFVAAWLPSRTAGGDL